MKYKLTIVIVITVLILALGIGEAIFMHKTFNKFQEKIEIITAQEQYNLHDVDNLAEWWNKKSMVIECTIPRLQITEVAVTIGELRGAVESEDMQSASALLIRLHYYGKEIQHMYSLNFTNII